MRSQFFQAELLAFRLCKQLYLVEKQWYYAVMKPSVQAADVLCALEDTLIELCVENGQGEWEERSS